MPSVSRETQSGPGRFVELHCRSPSTQTGRLIDKIASDRYKWPPLRSSLPSACNTRLASSSSKRKSSSNLRGSSIVASGLQVAAKRRIVELAIEWQTVGTQDVNATRHDPTIDRSKRQEFAAESMVSFDLVSLGLGSVEMR